MRMKTWKGNDMTRWKTQRTLPDIHKNKNFGNGLVLLTNLFYHLDNNYFAYFHAFGPAVLQKSEKIGQKQIFHEKAHFFLKNGLLSLFFQICLKILQNILLKLLFYLDSTTSQAFSMSFVALTKNFKKSHKNL